MKLKYYSFILFFFLCFQAFAQNKGSLQPKEVFKRVLATRVYSKNLWTLYGFQAEKIAEVLIGLNPTYISGLISVDANYTLSDEQVKIFAKIRELVQKKYPDCKFDVAINPRQYKKPEDLVQKMKEINEKISIDLWFLDFYTAENKSNSKNIEAAIAYAHEQGQLIGGNELSVTMLKNADFVVFNDGYGVTPKLKEDIVKMVADYKIPALFQLNNDIDTSDRDLAHQFVKRWEKHEREEYVKRLSRNQFSWKYSLMYPVFYPVYLGKESYNITKDEKMVDLYLELMKLYNQ